MYSQIEPIDVAVGVSLVSAVAMTNTESLPATPLIGLILTNCSGGAALTLVKWSPVKTIAPAKPPVPTIISSRPPLTVQFGMVKRRS